MSSTQAQPIKASKAWSLARTADFRSRAVRWFAAAQAAQKWRKCCIASLVRFAAAQAAQKNPK